MRLIGRSGTALVAVAILAGSAAAAPAQGAPHVWPGRAGGDVSAAREGSAQPVTAPAPGLVTLAVAHAPLRRVLAEIVRQSRIELYYSSYVVPLGHRVSLDVHNATAADALRQSLEGTGVVVDVRSPTLIILEGGDAPAAKPQALQQGAVHGRVVDAGTQLAIAGAQVTIGGTGLGATTDDRGAYRIGSVPEGAQTVTARRIGYAPLARTVTVGGGGDAVLDFALRQAPQVLDRVVVTGTVAPTQIRAIPTPITVITARDIARLGLTDVTGIFRGLVPGAVAVDAGAHDGYPGLSFRGGVDFNQAYSDSPVKLYVDGVEVAYTNALTQIDPKSIDHIEITRGPQASTLYGAGAIVGVIQIFTKKGIAGLAHPRIDAQLAAGGLQSQWAGTTLHQDHYLGIRGGATNLNYAAQLSYASTGQWAPEYKSRRIAYSGRLGTTIGGVAVDFSGAYTHRAYDLTPVDPFFVAQVRSGRWHTQFDPYYTKPFNPDQLRTDGTFGLNATYVARPWWTQRLVLGYDGYDNPRGLSAPRFLVPSDSLRSYGEFQRSRASVTYNSTFATQLGRRLASTLTVGADHWQTHENAVAAQEHANGTFAPGALIVRRAYANTGLFAQEQLGLADAFFVTAGVRGDWNSNFGGNYGTALAPRVGLSYTHTAGQLSYKLRASYGTAIQPPQPFQRDADVSGLPYSEQLANPSLGPEKQSGYDAGFELYFGTRASLQATYYDQRVENLISSIIVSAPSDTVLVSQNRNLGRIRNTGWELQGTTALGPVTLAATYSIFNSTVERIAAAALGDAQGQYHLGDRLLLIPRSSGGLTATFTGRATQVGLGLTYIGSFRNYDMVAYYNDRLGGDTTHLPARSYIIDYPSSMKWNAFLSQDLTSRLSGFIRVDNLTNSFRSEIDNITAVYGRLTVVGVKVKL